MMLQQCTVHATDGVLGLNLSRAPWDAYPWVSDVQANSNAELGGIRIGDTLLQLNGQDVLGMRISELAKQLRLHWQTGAEHCTMTMWRQQPKSNTNDAAEAAHAVQHGINQQSLQKFATCLQQIAQLLECPVCCEVIKPPSWQCCNGHVLCNNCRSRSVKCPICRVSLGPRGRCLLSDKLFTLLAENFPCDGVKTDKSKTQSTNEHHNQANMAASKSGTGKKYRRHSCSSNNSSNKLTQQDDAVILVINGVERGGDMQQILRGVPKGNEQSGQKRNNVNDAGRLSCALKVQQQQQEQQQQQQSSNNMLVKPKLKLSKKSWQITGRDQDELCSDEVANINNGQQQQQQHQQQQQQQQQVLNASRGQEQYQNYHYPSGKSCSSSGGGSSSSQQTKLFHQLSDSNSNSNKLSTVKRASTADAQMRASLPEIAFVVGANSAASLSAGSHNQLPQAELQPSIKTLSQPQPDDQQQHQQLQLRLH